MESLLKNLVGRQVTVYTGEGFSDKGMVENFDDRILVIKDSQGRQLFFVINNIRLIKPV